MPGWSITRAPSTIHWRRANDLAFAALDAAGLGSRGGAIRIHRPAFVGAFRQDRSANDRIARRHQHSVLEEMARRIHWWQYSRCRMISFTPWYIILAEFGIAVVFALLARTLRRGSWHAAVAAGVVGGASIFVCYTVAFLITDRLIK